MKALLYECIVCGRIFAALSEGPKRKYCSKKCRRRSSHAQQQVGRRLKGYVPSRSKPGVMVKKGGMTSWDAVKLHPKTVALAKKLGMIKPCDESGPAQS